jgi:hypothetical protein
MPWVNPVRRNQFVGSAIVASLLLVGAGFGIGYAVGGSDDNDHGPGRMYPGRYMPYDMRDHMGKQRFLPMPRPSKFPLLGPSTVTVTVTPAAAASS